LEVEVPAPGGGPDLIRRLVADTGAGSGKAIFQLMLAESDCLQAGGILMGKIRLAGAYAGWFPVYLVQIRIPLLKFGEPVPTVGVSHVPQGFDGVAGFKFLKRFHYGNFGDADRFGLDPLPVP
jgi:hypothetical protein